MHHFAAHAVRDRLLFEDWEEGLAVWRALTASVPLTAACVMPDHLHVLAPEAAAPALRALMSGHARWTNHRRGARGPLWEGLSDTGAIDGEQKIQRQIRYIHLNPCRAGLVHDPLAWPLSTHRDAVGLAVRPAVVPRREPERFHRFVSADPSVHVEGTDLPGRRVDALDLGEIFAAVSAATRRTVEELGRRSPERTLLCSAAKELCKESTSSAARALGVSERSLYRTPPLDAATRRILERLAGDERFPTLFARSGPGPGRRRFR